MLQRLADMYKSLHIFPHFLKRQAYTRRDSISRPIASVYWVAGGDNTLCRPHRQGTIYVLVLIRKDQHIKL
jgi:hypothetical protein